MAASIRIVKTTDDTEEECPAIGSKKAVCSICVQKEAVYTCPRCNVPYCSLDCYRSKKHEGCSESFYRDWVMDEMKEYGVKPEDRKKVEEMLSREYQHQAADSDDDDDDGDDDDDEVPDLHERLKGLDLDKDGAEVWQRLTSKEREEFAHMLKDGRLSSLVTVWTSWWMTKNDSLVEESEQPADDKFPPHLPHIPDIHQLFKGQPSSDVKHNVVNVLCAYAFVTRLHNGEHHHCPLQSAQELLEVCGVLHGGDNFPGPTEAAQSVIHHIHQKGYVAERSLPVTLLRDVVWILQGPRLSPLKAVMSALSDLCVVIKAASREIKQTDNEGKGVRRRRRGGGDDKRERKEGKKDDSESSASASILASSSSSTSLSEDPDAALRKQLLLTKKKVVFFLSWAQRYGMCLSSLCTHLQLEIEVLCQESQDTDVVQRAVEEGLKSGQLQPHAVTSPVTEITTQ